MKVLFVDDDPGIVKIFRILLERSGFEVDTAMDGVEALEKAGKSVYDVITLDVMMPRKNGFDALKELRARGDETPVLMFTALSSQSDQQKAFSLGADDFLVKNTDAQTLIARLLKLVKKKVGEES